MLKLFWNFLFHTKRRSLTVQTLLLAAVARLRVHLLPSKRLHTYMGDRKGETALVEIAPEKRKYVAWVADKVERVANRTPWESKCLVRAMVAQRLLRRYGLESTLYLGVGRNEDKKIAAHAWIRCGTYYVTGGNGDGYATVGSFVMEPHHK